MRELITTALDVLGLVAVAAGAGLAAAELHPGAGAGAFGATVLAGSWLITRVGRRRPRREG